MTPQHHPAAAPPGTRIDAQAAAAERQVLLYVGDYVDRGPHSSGVIDLLLDRPLPGFQIVHLLGNHEDAMLRFPDDVSVGPTWLQYGGVETLRSYEIELSSGGWRDERELRRLQGEVRRRVPRRHVEFLRGMKLMHLEGDYLFVHAGIRPGVPLELQDRIDLLWIRSEFLESRKDHGKIIVHGHTITEAPELRPNRIGIDTGAFFSDRLTAPASRSSTPDFHGRGCTHPLRLTRGASTESPSPLGGEGQGEGSGAGGR
jgi:serine/threonine protein phosphatase 1